MNRKTIIFISFILCICTVFAFYVSASGALLSPALVALEKQIEMKKCGVVNADIPFSAKDFDTALCVKSDFIRLESVPDRSIGVLKLGSLDLFENQIIAREDFEKIVFSPREDALGSTQFVFCNSTTNQTPVRVNCVINVLEEVNLAPTARNQLITSGANISAFKFLDASDPENDAISFEIISYPSHGTVSISDDSSGYFCYTPSSGFVGKDSFEYLVNDVYGNKSGKAKVEINVNKTATNIVFADLDGHWACNSAANLASKGLIEGVYDAQAGSYYFLPDEAISRGDFLAMALISAGKESDISFVTQTAFADDSSIPMNIKSYAQYALSNGIINGYISDDGTRTFASTSPLTRAEAAVMLNNILELSELNTDITVFTDFSDIPAWAVSAMANVSAAGIINGNGFGSLMPNSTLSRAEAVEILYNIGNEKWF